TYMADLNCGKIATVSGRYYAMDRDNRWDRVELAYNAIVHGQGEIATSACEAVQQSYDKDAADEFVRPTVIDAAGTIKDGDAVIFCNFRPDRGRELTKALVLPDFDG
ncbi:2,3-bisphosphoglycerate-independent phosphoglycerate mutase, partial [human gut metagenome]